MGAATTTGPATDAGLPEYLATLGLPGIFDVHVHFMHPRVLAKVWAYFDAAGPKLGRPWPVRYRTSDEDRVATLRAMGVAHYSALSYAHKPGVATFMNAWCTEFAALHPESLHSATFYPEPEADSYVAEALEQGVEVFKAHVQVGEFSPDDPLLDPVWARLERHAVPIVLHAGSGPAPGRYTGVEPVRRVLARFPDLRLVIAHLGTPETRGFVELARAHAHVRLDTTMAFVDFWDDDPSFEVVDHLVDLQAKVLFGSDFPNIPYPYAHQVEALARLGLGDDWMRDVLWHNGARLFGRA
ncbi:amidohydrolase family protein [Aeromicrobium sp.]|uniref:amidohydrolase family protein n=1 Tax=Aeromicrobium sp. TaxID=1871063 RepID=UPI0025BFA74A|nr:amidohydrolase family protein [Aeromicrobium sp.]